LIISLVWFFPFLLTCALTYLFSDPGLLSGIGAGIIIVTIYYCTYACCQALYIHYFTYFSHQPSEEGIIRPFYRWKNLRHREYKLFVQSNPLVEPGFEPSFV
jgi:hypothetical protein